MTSPRRTCPSPRSRPPAAATPRGRAAPRGRRRRSPRSPRRGRRRRSTACARTSWAPTAGGRKRVPTWAPSAASTRAWGCLPRQITSGMPAICMTRAARTLVSIPPEPTEEPAPPAHASRSSSTLSTTSSSRASGSVRGSAVYRAVDVGEQHHQVGRHERPHDRGPASRCRRSGSRRRRTVSFSLTTGTTPSDSSRSMVWRACRYAERAPVSLRGEQDLADAHAVPGEGARVGLHQPHLPHRGAPLRVGMSGGTALEPQHRQRRGDGARAHQHDLAAAGAQLGYLVGELAR